MVAAVAQRVEQVDKVTGSNPSSGQPHIAHQWGQWGPCDELATCPGSTLPSPWDNAGIGSSSNNPWPHGKG